MNPQYLVELRIGPAHWKIRRTTELLARVYGIESFMERVPHLTLYGPFTLGENASVRDLLDAIGSVASAFDWIPFRIHGWGLRHGLNGWVIAYNVDPSAPLRDLRCQLASRLSPLTETENTWDRDPSQAWFHITAANRLPADRARAIWNDLVHRGEMPERCTCGIDCHPPESAAAAPALLPLYIEQDALRIAFLEGETILAEYDLLGKAWLFAGAAQSPKEWQHTLRTYRRCSGLELTSTTSRNGQAYLLSDTHFGHANIIRYCARPFVPTDVQEMDAVLINNWNRTVDPGDTVYFLGDLRYGVAAASAEHYMRALNGRIVFISGNHDTEISRTIQSAIVDRNEERFLLIHDPSDAPQDFEGWTIHGHMHNNDLEGYPLVHFERRTINVSAEVTAYRPIPFSIICKLIDGIAGCENIPSLQSLNRDVRKLWERGGA